MTIRDIHEAAEHLRVSHKFIRRLVRTRQVPCMRGNHGAYLFDEDHIAAIKAAMTQPAISAAPVTVPRRRRAA